MNPKKQNQLTSSATLDDYFYISVIENSKSSSNPLNFISVLFEEKLSQLGWRLVPTPRFIRDVLGNLLHAQVVVKSPVEYKRKIRDITTIQIEIWFISNISNTKCPVCLIYYNLRTIVVIVK